MLPPLDQSGYRSDGNKGVLHIPQSSSINGTSPTDCLMSYRGHSLGKSYSSAEMQSMYSTGVFNWTIQNTRWGSFTLLQWCCRCILRVYSTRPSMTLVVGVLPFCWDAVCEFYRRIRLGQPGHSLGESYLSAEMQSVNSTGVFDWAIQDTRWGSLTFLLRCNLRILQAYSTGPSRTLVGGVLPFCRDSVGVFYRCISHCQTHQVFCQ